MAGENWKQHVSGTEQDLVLAILLCVFAILMKK